MTNETLRQASRIANLIEQLENALSWFEQEKVQRVSIHGKNREAELGEARSNIIELDYSVPYDQQSFIATYLRRDSELYFKNVRHSLELELARLKKKLEEL